MGDEYSHSLLAHLYTLCFEKRSGGLQFREWGQQYGLTPQESDRVFARLDRLGLVEAASLGPYCDITVRGILYVENNQLADPSLIRSQCDARESILRTLKKGVEEHGYGAYFNLDEIVAESKSPRETIVANVSILEEIGYIDTIGAGLFQLTPHGEEFISQHLLRVDLASSLDSLLEGKGSPQRRGHELEDLLANLARTEGFQVVPRARSTGEENDVVLLHGGESWLVSCKWEKKPASASYVQEIRSRIGKRPGSIGVLVSMGGFSKEAVEESTSHSSMGIVLLFSLADVKALFANKESLLEMLREKHKGFVAYRKALYREEAPGV